MFNKSFIFGTIFLAASAAQAQSSALTVSGVIGVTPCTVSLSGTGSVNFGSLTQTDVKTWLSSDTVPSRYIVGPNKSVSLSVLCASPAKLAISIVDNRATSATPSAAQQALRFGLGTYTPSGGTAKNLGSYYINANNFTIKTTSAGAATIPAKRLSTEGVASSSSLWHTSTGWEADRMIPGSSIGFTTTAAAGAPDSLVSIVGDLEVAVELLTDVVNTATSVINLDGSSTITLITL